MKTPININLSVFKRTLSVFLLLTVVSSTLIFTACGEKTGNESTEKYEAPLGTEITGLSEASVKTIISAAPIVTSALIELGCADMIYTADQYSYGIEALSSTIPICNMFSTSVEHLFQIDTTKTPDLFIAVEGFADPALIEEIKLTGSFPVIVFPKITSIDTLRSFVLYLGSVTGTTEKAVQIVTELDTIISGVKEAASAVTTPKKVYIEISDDIPHPAAGGDSLLTEIVEICGGINVFKSKTAEESKHHIEITNEEITAQNPDIIFTANRFLDDPCDEILSRSELITVNALINNEVYKLPPLASAYPSADIANVIKTIAFYLCSYTAG